MRQFGVCERLPVGSHVVHDQHHVLSALVATVVEVSRPLDNRLTGSVDVDAARVDVGVAGELTLLDHGDQMPVVAVLAGAQLGLDCAGVCLNPVG